MSENKKPSGLELLRVPFEKHQISKLPKPTKQQTEEVKNDFSKGIRCGECGGWHHPKVVHLDYVGHAALTDRLLDADPNWNWGPMTVNDDGTPKFDSNGGLWIKLTVCGVTRIGYGHPDGKSGGDAFKETIGDCLRNAAMRFGAALELWHKGDLHKSDDVDQAVDKKTPAKDALKEVNENKKAETADSNDPMDFVIQLGKNKLTGTKIKDHKIDFLIKYANESKQWHLDNNKKPHSNTQAFFDMVDLASGPKLDSSESIPF